MCIKKDCFIRRTHAAWLVQLCVCVCQQLPSSSLGNIKCRCSKVLTLGYSGNLQSPARSQQLIQEMWNGWPEAISFSVKPCMICNFSLKYFMFYQTNMMLNTHSWFWADEKGRCRRDVYYGNCRKCGRKCGTWAWGLLALSFNTRRLARHTHFPQF